MKSRHEFDNEVAYKRYLKTFFAAMAMQGILASGSIDSAEGRAQRANIHADALINELNK